MQEENEIFNENTIEFTKRVDFYWQFIAAYALAIFIYGLFRGSFLDGVFHINLLDPVVIMLLFFILISFAGLIKDKLMNRRLIIGPDYFILKNRVKEKRFDLKDIARIRIARERAFKIRGYNRIIKIRMINKKRWLRIRPNNYSNKRLLYNSFIAFKNKVG